MTDPVRLNDPCPYLHRLPPGGGVIYRCYGDSMPYTERLRYMWDLRDACHQNGLVLLIAGDDRLALEAGADGIQQHKAGFLRLLSGIDLNEKALGARGKPGLLVENGAQPGGKTHPIDGLKDIEYSKSISHFVGLERTD